LNDSLEQYTKAFLASRSELMAFINGMVRDLTVADDIYQQVWVEISKAVDQGRTIDEPGNWFRGVAKNLVLMHWRKNRTDKKHMVIDSRILELTEAAFASAGSDREQWAERRTALRRCIDTAPKQTHALIRMKYDLNYSIKTIAGEMKKSYGSVATSLTRIRQQLRDCVESQLRELGVRS